MTINPEFNKILADALAKADAQKDFIPMYVIEDITHEIRKYLEDVCINENEAEGIMFCLDVMDKYISGRENE